MCRQTTCSKCHKPSWAGCGAHVEQVLGHIPPADRCHCREDKASAKAAQSSNAADTGAKTLLSRLRGR